MTRTEKTLALYSDLPLVATTLYTVPASTKTVITGINVCNKTGTAKRISLSILRGGTDYYIFENVRIAGDDVLNFSGHIIVDTVGDIIRGFADNATALDVIISGWEQT